MVTGYLDNYYARLGVSREATPEEIRASYHQAARRLHPDTNSDPAATELFLQVQEAYETLSNETKRSEYDKTLPLDAVSPPDIMTNAIYSRTVLPVIGTSQLVYVLLDLMALPDPNDRLNAKSPPLNICIVLDTSTSMSGSRLDAVKETAGHLIQALKPEDILSIVGFNDRPEVIVPATRGLDIKKVEAKITQLAARGGTEIFKGLQEGLKQVSKNISPSYISHLILITDGRTYGDEEACLQLANEASERGITISGLGIGHEWNDKFLDEIAKRTGGSSAFASHPHSIREFLKTKFGQMNTTFANNVTLEFTTDPNVELRYAFRLSPDAASILGTANLHMGEIPLGQSLTVLMEFIVHSVPQDIKTMILCKGQLNMSIPTRAIPKVNNKFSLSRPTAVNPEVEPPPQVLVKAMSRLSLYRLQEQAHKELENGDVDKAAKKLNNLATQLLHSGEAGLANTVMLELGVLERGDILDEESKKQIKYGTRALVFPSGKGPIP